MNCLLYGAYGYTAKLILEKARYYGVAPILAGRNAEKLQLLAQLYDLPSRAFSLDDTEALDEALQHVNVVLHAAGPFRHTARPMIEACLRTHTHYLDITGEINIFEMVHQMDQLARHANIMMMPGTGFDVVPTDCLAAYLKAQLPSATHLQLAFNSAGGPSHGTGMTMIESLGEAGAMRLQGQIIDVPIGHKTMTVPFIEKDRFVMAIPWGDVSTAYYTTGIPNIETFTSIHPKTYRWVKRSRLLNPLLRTQFVKNQARKRLKARPEGPSEDQRAQAVSDIWGKVWDDQGNEHSARLQVKDGYTLTALTSLMITRRVLDGDWKPGHWTPAGLYGPDLIMEVEGSMREDLGAQIS